MPIGTVDWVADGMMSSDIIETANEPGRYELPIRNQFFHGSHPLGWVRSLSLTIDGRPIEVEQMDFVIRSQAVPVPLMPTIRDIWWQPREIAHLRFRSDRPLSTGLHDVEAVFNVSTFFFTPEIDTDDQYPTMTLRLAASLAIASTSGVAR